MLRIEVLCTSPDHPVNPWLDRWRIANRDRAQIVVRRDVDELKGGDLLFLVSCSQIVGPQDRAKFTHSLVLHASALPRGRGMSPHIWQILEGSNEIVLSMLEAEDKVDTGRIWRQAPIRFDGTELYDEINAKVFDAEIELMDWAVENFARVEPRSQQGEATYYKRRTPEDSKVSPDASIAEIFDLLRVSDPDRYPAFFEYRGARYEISLKKR